MLVGEERVTPLVRERLGGPAGELEIRRANVYRPPATRPLTPATVSSTMPAT
jgi:hypothetical protein